MLISPISAPSCSVPTDPTGLQYGDIQQRAYYAQDSNGGFKIRNIFDTANGATKSVMLDIQPSGGPDLTATWFLATTVAKEGQTNAMIKDMPGPSYPEVCQATLSVLGGSVLGAGNAAGPAPVAPNSWECPPGSYYDADLLCPSCPLGFTCPDGAPLDADKVPCSPNSYNDMLGLAGDCAACPTSGAYTNYAAAEQCDVEKVDLICSKNEGQSWAYDKASQQCQLCQAGTWRSYQDDSTTACQPCPRGTFSAEGDGSCTACPAGQCAPFEGLADQFSITGFHCVKCAEGSMPLLDSQTASINTAPVTGTTICDACPSGSFLPDDTQSCQICYKLADGGHDTITLCEKGTVSFYDNQGNRVPAGQELSCIRCADLDPALGGTQWAHTFAPRKGMTQCVPCPGGTVPTQTGPTDKCVACPNGMYRDAYTVSATCTDCGAGYETGPSSKMACTQCRPGTYMTQARADLTTVDSNTCDLCPQHTYRPTFGATSCLACPRGIQTANTGNVECTACPIGYYNNQQGQACKPAPAGTFVNTTGAFVSTPCPKGSWNNEEASDNCNPCRPGKYGNTLGSKECKIYAAGTYSAGQATSCIDCRPGYAAPAGAATCSPCKPGTYAPDAKSATCKLCPKGFHAREMIQSCPTNAMKQERPCPRGTFSNKEGNRLFSPCAANSYSLGGGSALSPSAVMACVKCPPGTNTRGLVGQSKCQVIRPQVKRLFYAASEQLPGAARADVTWQRPLLGGGLLPAHCMHAIFRSC
ncbi:hypothetical protein ABPG75_008299 [Micractinium tetrahymenae]